MKLLTIDLPVQCPKPQLSACGEALAVHNISHKIIGEWPYLKLRIFMDESQRSTEQEELYIFSLGMLIGQFIH